MGNCCSSEDSVKTKNNKIENTSHDNKSSTSNNNNNNNPNSHQHNSNYAPSNSPAAPTHDPVFTPEAQQIFDGISSLRTGLRNRQLKPPEISDKINEIQAEVRKLRKLCTTGDNQLLLARSINALGHTISTDHIGRAEEGLGLQKEALQIYKKYYNNTDNEVLATSLDRVGVTTLNRGQDFEEAIGYLTQALDMRRRLFGNAADHSEVCASLNSLAVAYEWVGRFNDAGKLRDEALAMYRRIHPAKEGIHEDEVAFDFMNAMSGVMASPRKNRQQPLQQQQQHSGGSTLSDSAADALLGGPPIATKTNNNNNQTTEKQHHNTAAGAIADDEFL